MNVWRKINELEGYEVECKNVADRKIVWKVVKEVEDDKFISIRIKEKMHYFVPNIAHFMIQLQNLVKRILHSHSGRFGQAILTKMMRNYKKSLRTKTKSEEKDMQGQLDKLQNQNL